MAHFNLIKTDDILNGPVDYSTPVGSSHIFLCSKTVRDHIERRKPATKSFTANCIRDAFWLNKFEIHTELKPDYVKYARGKSGQWYVEAISL